MIWGPFLLALGLGLVVSAGLYFAYLWPQVEPEDEAADDAAASPPAASAVTEAETEQPAPASETSPA